MSGKPKKLRIIGVDKAAKKSPKPAPAAKKSPKAGAAKKSSKAGAADKAPKAGAATPQRGQRPTPNRPGTGQDRMKKPSGAKKAATGVKSAVQEGRKLATQGARAASGDLLAAAQFTVNAAKNLHRNWKKYAVGIVAVVAAYLLAIYTIISMIGAGLGGGGDSSAAQKASTEGMAESAATSSGFAEAKVSAHEQLTQGSNVHWAVLAAIEATTGSFPDGAGEFGVDVVELAKQLRPEAKNKKNSGKNTKGKKNGKKAKKPTKKEQTKAQAFAENRNLMATWLFVEIKSQVDSSRASHLDFDAGAVAIQSHTGGYVRYIDDHDKDSTATANVIKHTYIKILKSLPLSGNPERAEEVFDLARTWALGTPVNPCTLKPDTATASTTSGWANPVTGRLSSPYGMRKHPTLGVWKLHDGTDIAAPQGTPVYAAASGTAHVTSATAYGSHFVTIDHGDGVQTQYGHMSSHTVNEGQQVQAGEQVGTVGSQGYSTGPHLHFIVRQDGETTDPAAFMETKGVSLGTDPAGQVVGGSTGTETVATTTGTTPDHQVVAISIDGLAARALTRIGWDNLPNFNRMRETGASTLNARTMVERTLTLPNHTSMITGRPILGSNGHGVAVNHDVPGKVDDFAGTDVASMFSTAADSGYTSALLTGKSKFRLFDRTWPAINRFVLKGETQDRALTRAAVAQINRGTDLTFLHLSTADHTGHAKGWMSPAYLRGVRDLDRMLGQVLDAAGSNTTVLLTSDHGGTGRRHPNATDRRNYQIPFFAWGSGVPSGADLYELNESRKNPGKGRPGYTGAQPIRNGDIANAAAALLGANTVPGSVVGATNPLKFTNGDDTDGGTTVLPDTWSGTSATGEQVTLDKKQLGFARTIATVGKQAGVGDDGVVIAFMTVFVESRFRNYASTVYQETIGHEYPKGSIGSDHDSVGLFQQRPASGWGDPMQLLDPEYEAKAFYGGPDGPNGGSPMGLIDHTGWESRPKGEVAQDVQVSAHPERYEAWEGAATELLSVVGTGAVEEDDECAENAAEMSGGFTVASFNVLGFSHTQGKSGRRGFPSGKVRFPAAMNLLEERDVSVAALNEMHPQNKQMFKKSYAGKWGSCEGQGDMVVWRKDQWTQVHCGGVTIPYFFGIKRPQPFVLLENRSTQERLWFMGIHNPANAHGQASHWRRQSLQQELAAVKKKASDGVPIIMAGDFNDVHDGASSAQCVLTPYMTNAFGKSPHGCAKPKGAAPVDHIFSHGVALVDAKVDDVTQKEKISDHPLVTASVPSNDDGGNCSPSLANPIRDSGVYTPNAIKLSDCIYGSYSQYVDTIGGYRSSSRSGNHERGCALDIMIKDWDGAGRAGGQTIADWVSGNLKKLGAQYVIWRQQIWSADRNGEGWRHMSDRGSPTQNHFDHVHVSLEGPQCVDE